MAALRKELLNHYIYKYTYVTRSELEIWIERMTDLSIIKELNRAGLL